MLLTSETVSILSAGMGSERGVGTCDTAGEVTADLGMGNGVGAGCNIDTL